MLSNEESKDFFGIRKDARNPNLIVLGVPWDESSSFRKCSANAPSKIRFSTSSKIYNPFSEELVDLTSFWRILDLGDLETKDKMLENIYLDLYRKINAVKGEDAVYFFMGGDHITTYLCMKAVKQVEGGEWYLIYFDSHPDLYSSYGGNPFSHACVVRRIIEEEIVSPNKIYQVGVRAATKEQFEFALKKGVKIISTQELYLRGVKEALKSVVKALKCEVGKVYFSFDLDVLDPSFAPGVGNPEPGGLSTRQLIEAIKTLISPSLRCFDIVEYCPAYDPAGITGFTASKIIRETLGSLANIKYV